MAGAAPEAKAVLERLRQLEAALENGSNENQDLTFVVRRMLDLHVGRLDRFVCAAQELVESGQDLSRDRILSLLCFVIAFQQNH